MYDKQKSYIKIHIMTNLLCMINRNHTSKYTYDLPTMYDKQKSYMKIHIMTNLLCMINRNHTSKYTL